MTYTLIAPIGKQSKQLFSALAKYHFTQVIILVEPQFEKTAQRIKQALEKVHITVKVQKIGNIFSDLVQLLKSRDNTFTILHAGCSNQQNAAATICAGYVFGIPSLSDQLSLLPIMRLGYHEFLSIKKQDILRILGIKGTFSSLEGLAKEVNMSLPLLSYHIHGNVKSKGLVYLGLVHTRQESGCTQVFLTDLGKLLA